MLQRMIACFMSIIAFFSTGFMTGGYTAGQAKKIASDPYASAGRGLTKELLKDCSSLVDHSVSNRTDGKGVPFVWPVAAYIEAMADAYRLFPSDIDLKLRYKDALTNVIEKYKVKNAEIAVPTRTFEGVSYYNSYPGGEGDYYYDDNEWICISLLSGYNSFRIKALLNAAEENLEFLWTGWDDVLGGGLYWSSDYDSKNACSNAPAAIAFLTAYQITGKEIYLERGKLIYDWMNETMREDDLFLDSIGINGSVNHWKGAYNQATMIYAGTLLYELSGENEYYDLTKATVDATVPLMFEQTTGENGGENVSMRENPIFKSWCVGWLARSWVKFYEADPEKDSTALELLCSVLNGELSTKDGNGLYDPFFLSGGRDDENYNEILSQSGVAAAFLCAGYYSAVLK